MFFEPREEAYSTPLKIGKLFMNRFAVDEDAASEILKTFELEKYVHLISPEDEKQKGMDLIIKIDRLICFRIILHNL